MKKLIRAAEDLLETLMISLFSVTVIFSLLSRIAAVDGSSMESTLMTGDKFIMTAWCPQPKQGDIVVINAESSVTIGDDGELERNSGMGGLIVKRIIAVGGQTVDFDFERGIVYVDGEVFHEDYIIGLTHADEGVFTGRYPVEVPKDYVFVMGDNRRDSLDSRSLKLGFVAVDDIEGRALLRVSPMSSFGRLS